MTRALPALALLLLSATAAQAQNFDTIQVRRQPVADGVHVLMGAGGNIGLSVGADGVFLVDDQYAPMTAKIRAAVRQVSRAPIRFVLNTHWHGDHTGGNENLGQSGTLIVAHDNVRARMSSEQFSERFGSTTRPSPAVALPVVTFDDAVTFHLNGDEIHAFHVPPAHTDGDAIVHFRRANVIHMGDTFLNGGYPFIDLSSGGRVMGVIGAADRVLAMADDDTRIIPGHGPVTDRARLREYRDMIDGVASRVAALRRMGRTLDEVKAERLTAGLDARWGGGFISGDFFVETVFRSLP